MPSPTCQIKKKNNPQLRSFWTKNHLICSGVYVFNRFLCKILLDIYFKKTFSKFWNCPYF